MPQQNPTRKNNEFRLIRLEDAPPATSPYRLTDRAGADVAPVNRFLDALATRGLSGRTVRSYGYDLLHLCKWLSARSLSVEALCECHLLQYIRYQRHKTGRAAAPATINHRLHTVRAFYRFLVGHDIPAGQGTSRPRASIIGNRSGFLAHLGQGRRPAHTALRVKVPRKLIYPLTNRQAAALVDSFRTFRDRAIAGLMLLCGLRSCEVVALTEEDLAFSDNGLRVQGKGNKERIVPCPFEVRRTIDSYLRLERPARSAKALFVVLKGPRRGRPLTLAGLRTVFRHHRKHSGLSNANPHRLRHSFASNMARAGLQLTALMKLMGHSQISQTMRYIEFFPGDVRQEFFRVLKRLRGRSKDSGDET